MREGSWGGEWLTGMADGKGAGVGGVLYGTGFVRG